MKITIIKENKKDFLDLLLLGDEQESMIDKYIDKGDMFALYDDDLRCICVVTNEGNSIFELKNIAVYPKYQKCGYGRKLIEYILNHYDENIKTLLVGTGDVPSTVEFYKKCGFILSHRIKNFFTDNYDHPIFENGKQLVDMIYLKREIKTLSELTTEEFQDKYREI